MMKIKSGLSGILTTIYRAATALALTAICVFTVLYREYAFSGVYAGLMLCLNTLIPSLFPFVVLSCIISHSATSELLCRPLSPILRHVFRLPPCAASAVIFGLTAGYPTGAKITASLYEDGRMNREQTSRLLCFCTSPGLAFSLYTASMLRGGSRTGFLLFAACAASPLLIGAFISRRAAVPPHTEKSAVQSGSFTNSVREGVSAMVSMCAFVIVFSGMISILEGSGLISALSTVLSAILGITTDEASAAVKFLLEVTSGVQSCGLYRLSPVLAALGLGFSGVCIHTQLFSFFKGSKAPLSYGAYLFTRIMNSLLCAAVFVLLSFLFPTSEPVSTATAPLISVRRCDPTLSAALLLLSAYFLIYCGRLRRRGH